MTWNEFVYTLADFFQSTFLLLEKLGGMPNLLFIVVGFIATTIWVLQMVKHQQNKHS